MAARKVIESVEVAPPFKGLTRVVAGKSYPSGTYFIAPGSHMLPMAGLRPVGLNGFIVSLSTMKRVVTGVEGHVWFIPSMFTEDQKKTLRCGDRIGAGTLIAGNHVKATGIIALLLVDDDNEALSVRLNTGDVPFRLDRPYTVLHIQTDSGLRVIWQAP